MRLRSDPARHLILETKGCDEPAEVKAQAAERWVNAVNACGQFGTWAYAVVEKPTDVGPAVDRAPSSR